MDILLNSNASSSFNSVVDGVETNQNPFVYRYAQNVEGTSLSGISRTFQEVNASNSSSTFGTAVDFHIPKNGLLKNMFVKMKLTKTGSDVCNGAVGALQISRISLITSGRILAEQTGEGLLAKLASQPEDCRENIASMLNLQNTAGNYTSATSLLCYVPCLFSCVEALEKCYDTNFVAPLVLRCHVESNSKYIENSSAGASSFSALAMSLYCEFIREPAEHQQKRIQADYSDGALQRVQWNEMHEFSDATTRANAISHEIKSNNYVQEMYIYADAVADVISNSGIGLKLDTLKIEANGQVIADFGNSEDAELLRRIQDTDPDKWQFCGGSGWDASMGPYNYRYKYNFGLSNDTRKVYGGVATRELSNFKVTVKTNDTTASATRLHVILKYAQLESIESASGKVTTSISS